MGFTLYQLLLPVLFLMIVFGLGYYQKRKKTVRSKLRLVVSNERGPSATTGQGKTFERHLESVKSSPRRSDTKQ
jgi:hypothetical protein